MRFVPHPLSKVRFRMYNCRKINKSTVKDRKGINLIFDRGF